MKTPQELSQEIEDAITRLAIYQEGFAEAETGRARLHYEKLCCETHDRIEELEVELTEALGEEDVES